MLMIFFCYLKFTLYYMYTAGKSRQNDQENNSDCSVADVFFFCVYTTYFHRDVYKEVAVASE